MPTLLEVGELKIIIIPLYEESSWYCHLSNELPHTKETQAAELHHYHHQGSEKHCNEYGSL
jgi:hypothetical protein